MTILLDKYLGGSYETHWRHDQPTMQGMVPVGALTSGEQWTTIGASTSSAKKWHTVLERTGLVRNAD
jgi:hypothetical protein